MIKNGKILLLQDVAIDFSLSKYKKEEKSAKAISNSFILIDNPTSNSDGNTEWGMSRDANLEYLDYLYSNTQSWLIKLKIWLYKKLYGRYFNVRKDKRFKVKQSSLKKFFDSIKLNVSEMDKKNIDEILSKYESTLKNAEYNNQIALTERIKDYIDVLQNELLLSTSKFNKFLSEEDIVKFYNVASTHEKYKTGLCLTYIKNFVKIIPEEVTELKKEADSLRIFDNYVILHYDYSGNSVDDTKEEKARKKDPILFGVIKGSTNLYYIGDWIDEYCDLTLDVIIKKIGKKSVKTIDYKSVKNNIEKI